MTPTKSPMLEVSVEIVPWTHDPRYLRVQVDVHTPHRTASHVQTVGVSVFQSHFDYVFDVLKSEVRKEICPKPHTSG